MTECIRAKVILKIVTAVVKLTNYHGSSSTHAVPYQLDVSYGKKWKVQKKKLVQFLPSKISQNQQTLTVAVYLLH